MESTPDQPEENRSHEPENRDPLKRATEKTRSFAEYSGIAFQMLGTIGAGVWIGMKIDDWQQTKSPIWTIILSLTAIGASLYLFIRQLTSK